MPKGSEESRPVEDELDVLSDDDWAEIKKMLGIDVGCSYEGSSQSKPEELYP